MRDMQLRPGWPREQPAATRRAVFQEEDEVCNGPEAARCL